MIEIFVYTLATVLVMFVFGSGLTLLATPKQLRKYAFWLSPWYFIFFIIFTLTTFSLLGFSTADVGLFIILFLIGLAIYVWKKTSRRFEFSLKQELLLIFFITMSITLNLSPLIRRHGFMTTVSMGNNDAIVYTLPPDFLTNYSLQENFYLDTSYGVSGILDSGYRWGPAVIESFFLYLFNLQGYQLTYVLQVILYALSIPLAYILLQQLFKKSTMSLIILAIMFTFNANMLYMVYHVFFGQVIFWGLSLSILILLFSYLDILEKSKKNSVLYEVSLGTASVVFFLTYHEPAILIFAPLLIYLTYLFIRNKEPLHLKTILKIGFIALLLGSVSIINAVAIDFLQSFGSDPDAKIGWELFRTRVPYANPFEMVGFWSIHNFEPLPIFLAIILSLVIVSIFVYGFIRLKKNDLLLCYINLFLFFVIWMGPIKKNFFAYNRAVTYTLPLFLIIFTIGLTELSKKGKVIKLIIFSSLILIIFSGIKLNKRFLREHASVDKSYISLQELPSDINEPIYVEENINQSLQHWRNIWVSYFIYPQIKNSRFPMKFINNEYALRVPSGGLVMIAKPVRRFQPTNVLITEKVWGNEYYMLGRICNDKNCLLKSSEDLSKIEMGKSAYEDSLLIKGWSVKEGGDTRWSNNKVTTLRLVAGNNNVQSLALETFSLSNDQHIQVFVNEESVGKKMISLEWKELVFDLNRPAQNEVLHIKLVFDKLYNQAQMGISQDTRDLTANFKTIKLR
ncbi:hypothetical protein A3A93_06485 [Candidatus Roizmanbacteria bacterium RIFCSPLOWO2_01_FULL_38_12]|uniref:Glycosyltransferase RgtA/B/C/D-like domain-containing protein n=1 Tax=Candidatus Roizmanbacteria bacterium RIFCSPLOWO2_01_FULL_38_12 TaxID=1802061 RepID=A0A1F7IU34_9BACT|nr:MAG: hypothetical protein A3A93_06485 [Candidatus Roizmanbacteria bacterium RIFCSPLOWO2_01_FULL_38_12]